MKKYHNWLAKMNGQSEYNWSTPGLKRTIYLKLRNYLRARKSKKFWTKKISQNLKKQNVPFYIRKTLAKSEWWLSYKKRNIHYY